MARRSDGRALEDGAVEDGALEDRAVERPTDFTRDGFTAFLLSLSKRFAAGRPAREASLRFAPIVQISDRREPSGCVTASPSPAVRRWYHPAGRRQSVASGR